MRPRTSTTRQGNASRGGHYACRKRGTRPGRRPAEDHRIGRGRDGGDARNRHRRYNGANGRRGHKGNQERPAREQGQEKQNQQAAPGQGRQEQTVRQPLRRQEHQE
jgi:hypothetical protein